LERANSVHHSSQVSTVAIGLGLVISTARVASRKLAPSPPAYPVTPFIMSIVVTPSIGHKNGNTSDRIYV
jgi:hypothetical protein